MFKNIIITGDVRYKCKKNIPRNTCLHDILYDIAGGLKAKKKIKLIQIGGVLGKLISPSSLDTRLEEYTDYLTTPMIMYLGDNLCPVDYLRFLTRHMIRELRCDSPYIRELNHDIEMIAQGKSSISQFQLLKKKLKEVDMSDSEEKLVLIFNYVIDNFDKVLIEHIIDKKCKVGICRSLFKSQCINACPAEVHIPGYIELMKVNEIDSAYQLMRQSNPLSFVCGKICARPCEEKCRRGEIETSVGVRALKHYTASLALTDHVISENTLPSKNKSVAIIGAGPAGLTASYYLQRTGYQVTIYDQNPLIGGMLATGIPSYRLNQSTIDTEVNLIKQLGVKILTNVQVGKDIKFSEIEKNHDAVLLATGRQKGNKIGPLCNQIEAAVDFLKDVKIENRKSVGESVIVVGGGDVAFDAARTALRLGAKSVKIVSLECFDELPASQDEVESALKEGIHLLDSSAIDEFIVENNQLSNISLKRCLSIWDKEGRFDPTFDNADIKTIKTDHVICAIGQQANNDYLDDQVTINNDDMLTSVENIFTAGDMIQPGIAIQAIADGKNAASLIDKYLGGNGLYLGDEIIIPETPLNPRSWSINKSEEDHNDQCDFHPITVTFDYEVARKEADRCMRCDRNSQRPLYLK